MENGALGMQQVDLLSSQLVILEEA